MTDTTNEKLSPAELLKKFGTNKENAKFKNGYINDLVNDEKECPYREHGFTYVVYNRYNKGYSRTIG